MKSDIEGKIRNTSVPKSKPLLPVFEAIVNSFQSILQSNRTDGYIEIEIVRTPRLLPEDSFESEIQKIIIRDNGTGFTEENFKHFITADTTHKLNIGGKGVGRFTWLNVFSKAEIKSVYAERDQCWERSFTFSPNIDSETDFSKNEVKRQECLTEIQLVNIKQDFLEFFPKSSELIAQQIVEHCFLMLRGDDSPHCKFIDIGKETDLNEYVSNFEREKAFVRTFKIDNQEFEYIGLRVDETLVPLNGEHKLFLTAHGRAVITNNLKSMVPTLKGNVTNEEGIPFLYSAFVTGKFLDESVNENRTGFRAVMTEAEKLAESSALPEPCIDEIKQAAIELLKEDLVDIIVKINEQKKLRVRTVIRNYPQYRSLLTKLDQIVDKIPPLARESQIEEQLNAMLHSERREVRKKSAQVLKSYDGKNKLENQQAVKDLFDKVDDLQKSALAEYVIQRKVVIDFFEKCLSVDRESNKTAVEEVLHDTVFPIRSTSRDDVYELQNLWLIDERLNYHVYLASDKSFKSIEVLDSVDDKRPDILVLNDSTPALKGEAEYLFENIHLLGESKRTALSSFVLIEFKRPNHTDYRNDNPIHQIYNQIREIRSSKYRTDTGRIVTLSGHNVAAYAYIVCDLTPKMIEFAENAQLLRTPDEKGYYGFNSNSNINAYIEILSYDKIVEDAKMRNRVLFEKLQLDF